jgi:hypothetical protein
VNIGSLQPNSAGTSSLVFTGTVTLSQQTTFFKPATVTAPNRLPVYPTSLVLKGTLAVSSISGQLDAAIPVVLAGTVSAPVDVIAGGTVSLLNTVTADNSQTITLDGGKVNSLATLPNFAASIQLNSGKLSVAGNGNLGTGTITVQVPAQKTATISTTATTAVTLDNPLILNGGTLTLSGPLAFSQAFTVNAGILDTQGALTISGALTLNGGTFGTKGKTTVNGAISFGGGSPPMGIGGNVAFNGLITLNIATTLQLASGAVVGVAGGIAGGVSLTVNGGELTLSSSTGLTALTAGPGSKIILLDGWTDDTGAHAGDITKAGGIVVDNRTHKIP